MFSAWYTGPLYRDWVPLYDSNILTDELCNLASVRSVPVVRGFQVDIRPAGLGGVMVRPVPMVVRFQADIQREAMIRPKPVVSYCQR